MILVSSIRFSGMPDLSTITLEVALWVKSKRPPFAQSQIVNQYHFQHKQGRFMFMVSIMGFSGMPDIVVLSENILDIAM